MAVAAVVVAIVKFGIPLTQNLPNDARLVTVNMLDDAIQDDDASEVARLVRAGVDVNSPDHDGDTPLMLACGRADLRIVQTLLAAGAEIHPRDHHGWTALHHAMHGTWDHQVADVAKELLDHGAIVDAVDEVGCTPLMFAAFADDPEVVKLLLSRGANPNRADGGGLTPLMYAVQHSYSARNIVHRVQALLDHGADPQARTPDGQTALDMAQAQLSLAKDPSVAPVAPALIDGAKARVAELNLEPELDQPIRETFDEVKAEIVQNHAAAIANLPIVVRLLESRTSDD